MEELGDAEKYSFGIFYNNVRVLVERMPGNPRLITMMQVYDTINNKSATVDLIEPVFDENHEGKRSICTRLVEMTGRTRQNTDYRLEKYGNGAVTVSDRKASYCMSQLSQSAQDGETDKVDVLTKKTTAFKSAFDGPLGLGDDEALTSLSPPTASYAMPVEEKKVLDGGDGDSDGTKGKDEEEEGFVFTSYNKSKGGKAVTPKTSKKPPLQVRTKKRTLYSGKKQP